MNWTQQIESWFGASFILVRASYGGFKVERVWRRQGVYWRKNESSGRILMALRKVNMAVDAHRLSVSPAPHDGALITDQKMWAPLTKTLAAWYVMLEDEPEST